jgi:hypothetical protein
MTTYTLKLTPDLRNLSTEGGLDTSVSLTGVGNSGVSAQRTGYIEVNSGSNRKIVEVKDGETFTDTMQTITNFGFIV